MDHLSAMRVFVRVVDEQSFTAAARSLGMPRSSVSRQLSWLEGHLGARLLNRSTRTMAITEVGRSYHERCVQILADIDEAETAVTSLQTRPRGTLRITAPLGFGQLFLGKPVAEFLSAYPDVHIEISLSDRIVDLVEEGFDIAIRIGLLPDSSLIARRIGRANSMLSAAPSYLQTRPPPATFADLRHHDCLRYAFQSMGWRTHDGEFVNVHGRMLSNNGELLRQAALAGHGVLLSPTFVIEDDVAAGRLVQLLPNIQFEQAGIYAMYPHSRHVSAKVRHFVDFLSATVKNDPLWTGANLTPAASPAVPG